MTAWMDAGVWMWWVEQVDWNGDLAMGLDGALVPVDQMDAETRHRLWRVLVGDPVVATQAWLSWLERSVVDDADFRDQVREGCGAVDAVLGDTRLGRALRA